MLKEILNKRNVVLIALCLSCSLFSFSHPIKISTCIITQNNNEVYVSLYFFYDDFETHLKSIYGDAFSLNNNFEPSFKNVLHYINKHYNLSINNRSTKLKSTSNLLKDNVFKIDFKVKRPIRYLKGETSIKLKNTLLLEAFKDQTNIVRIDFLGDGNYRTLEFNQKNKNLQITL